MRTTMNMSVTIRGWGRLRLFHKTMGIKKVSLEIQAYFGTDMFKDLTH